MQWLKDLHWELYYEYGLHWLPKPPYREWHVLLLDGMEPPFPRPGYVQVVTRMPSGLGMHPMYAARQTMPFQ